jgi:hypothetical protein
MFFLELFLVCVLSSSVLNFYYKNEYRTYDVLGFEDIIKFFGYGLFGAIAIIFWSALYLARFLIKDIFVLGFLDWVVIFLCIFNPVTMFEEADTREGFQLKESFWLFLIGLPIMKLTGFFDWIDNRIRNFLIENSTFSLIVFGLFIFSFYFLLREIFQNKGLSARSATISSFLIIVPFTALAVILLYWAIGYFSRL